MSVVVDADVLVGALDATEPHHARAAELLRGWHAARETLLVSPLTLTEVLVAPAGRIEVLRRARAAITALGCVLQQPTALIVCDAARLRLNHPITLADAHCLASARASAAALATFDRNLMRVAETEGLALVPTLV